MPNRAQDWFAQAERDLEQARASEKDARHEWACFAAQQSAEMAVKALHLSMGQEARHVVARLLSELPVAPADLQKKAKGAGQFLRRDALRERTCRRRAIRTLRSNPK
jgi:HEPN domain-containing protein